MYTLISGMLVMGYVVCGTFFVKYWRLTRDRLFAFFALAFWVLAAQRLVLIVVEPNPEAGGEHYWPVYVVRLIAFLLILAAIVDKNRAGVKK